MTRNHQRHAGPGTVWVCSACGKTHEDRYGMEGKGSYGWDESCMLNAVLCTSPKDKDGWRAIPECDEPAPTPEPTP